MITIKPKLLISQRFVMPLICIRKKSFQDLNFHRIIAGEGALVFFPFEASKPSAQSKKRRAYASHLYPNPHTVTMCLGFEGSSSIFIRRRRIFTSTIFSSP